MKFFCKKGLPILIIYACLLIEKSFGQGINFSDSLYNVQPRKYDLYGKVKPELPSKVDLSAYVPPVIDQGKYPACVCLSTTYYLRTILQAIQLNITNKDSILQLAYSPSFVYNLAKDSTEGYCKEGLFIEKALDVLKSTEILSYTQQGFPYCEKNRNLPTIPGSQVLDYIKLFGLTANDNKTYATKKALSENAPVLLGINTTPRMARLDYWDKIFNELLKRLGLEHALGLWQPEKDLALGGGHAVCVVGYDDNWHGGAFLVVNSYGPEWGDNGYFWIKYADYEVYAKYGYQVYIDDVSNHNGPSLTGKFELYRTDQSQVAINADKFEGKIKHPSDSLVTMYELQNELVTGSLIKMDLLLEGNYFFYMASYNDKEKIFYKNYPFNDYSALIASQKNIVLPSPDSTYTLMPPAAQEYLILIFSKKAIDFDQHLSKIQVAKGSIKKRIYQQYKNEIIPSQYIDFNPKKVSFSLNKNHEGSILPIVVTYKQMKELVALF